MHQVKYEIYIPSNLTDASKCQVFITEIKDKETKTYEWNGKSCQMTEDHFKVEVASNISRPPTNPEELTKMFSNRCHFHGVFFHKANQPDEDELGKYEQGSTSDLKTCVRHFLNQVVDVELNPDLQFLVETYRAIRGRDSCPTFFQLCDREWWQVSETENARFYPDYVNYYDYVCDIDNKDDTEEIMIQKIRKRDQDLFTPFVSKASSRQYNQELAEAREHLEKTYMPIYHAYKLGNKINPICLDARESMELWEKVTKR